MYIQTNMYTNTHANMTDTKHTNTQTHAHTHTHAHALSHTNTHVHARHHATYKKWLQYRNEHSHRGFLLCPENHPSQPYWRPTKGQKASLKWAAGVPIVRWFQRKIVRYNLISHCRHFSNSVYNWWHSPTSALLLSLYLPGQPCKACQMAAIEYDGSTKMASRGEVWIGTATGVCTGVQRKLYYDTYHGTVLL